MMTNASTLESETERSWSLGEPGWLTLRPTVMTPGEMSEIYLSPVIYHLSTLPDDWYGDLTITYLSSRQSTP